MYILSVQNPTGIAFEHFSQFSVKDRSLKWMNTKILGFPKEIENTQSL